MVGCPQHPRAVQPLPSAPLPTTNQLLNYIDPALCITITCGVPCLHGRFCSLCPPLAFLFYGFTLNCIKSLHDFISRRPFPPQGTPNLMLIFAYYVLITKIQFKTISLSLSLHWSTQRDSRPSPHLTVLIP